MPAAATRKRTPTSPDAKRIFHEVAQGRLPVRRLGGRLNAKGQTVGGRLVATRAELIGHFLPPDQRAKIDLTNPFWTELLVGAEAIAGVLFNTTTRGVA